MPFTECRNSKCNKGLSTLSKHVGFCADCRNHLGISKTCTAEEAMEIYENGKQPEPDAAPAAESRGVCVICGQEKGHHPLCNKVLNYEGQIRDREKEIQSLRSNNTDLMHEAKALKEETHKAQVEATVLRTKVTSWDGLVGEVDRLNVELKKHEAQYAGEPLTAEVAAIWNAPGRAHDTIKDLERRLTEYRDRCNTLESVTDEANRQNGHNEREANRWMTEASALRIRIEEYKQQNPLNERMPLKTFKDGSKLVSIPDAPSSPENHPVVEVTGARRGSRDLYCFTLMSPIAVRRYAEVMHEGAGKYDEYNWEKGMSIRLMMEHAVGHFLKYLEGDRSEDHLGHALWNAAGAVHSEEAWPELNKVGSKENKNGLRRITTPFENCWAMDRDWFVKTWEQLGPKAEYVDITRE